VLWSLYYFISCCPAKGSEPSLTQERIETVTAERVRTAVTMSVDTGHPCHVHIINLTMKTVPSECPGDGRHGMAQQEQERCWCHAVTLASGWLRRADMCRVAMSAA
jgi:NaMN:DMB phosphoribosyltransferase